jgi:pilus assembly protein Flp/PilA
VRSLIDDFWHDERGTTSIEYAIMAAGIAMAVIAAVNTLGQNVKSAFFDKIAASF